jgi:protein O-GlcNAc transferase
VLIISPDLRRHSVAYFLEPLIRHHARTGLDLFILSTAEKPDAVTNRLRALVTDQPDRWLDIPHTDHAAILSAIGRLQPDVIIECAGHTIGTVLPLLATPRARLQLSYCGYAHTTGLPTIAHRLSDEHADPEGLRPEGRGPSGAGRDRGIEGSRDQAFALLLPTCFLCYAPPDDAPPIRWSPPTPTRPLTLGSFNIPTKLSDHTLALWARLLRALPEARLRLKLRGCDWPATADHHRRRFAAAGLPVDRLDLTGLTREHTHHLAAYDHLDLALDTFPYHGTTTTCEALLMGVPVITRVGSCHHSRVGLSLLSTVGCPELIATTDEQYIALAVALARDPARLARYRQTLRDQLLASPLCDQPAFAQRFGQTIRSALD